MRKNGDIPLSLSFVPFLVAIAGLAFALVTGKAPLYSGLAVGWLAAALIAVFHAHSLSSVLRATYRGMKSTFFIVGILLLIAAVISSWLSSGTVPAMIRYGTAWVQPRHLVATAFLLAAFSSMALGSSVATLSTMGVALTGMAQVFHLSPALIGGALLSGAMVGDRTSPVSGTFHLLAHMTGTRAEENYKPMWQTGLPMVIACFFLYLYLGNGISSTGLKPASPWLQDLSQDVKMPGYLLLPPCLVLLLAVLRVPILLNLGIGVALGVFLSVWVQGEPWFSVLRSLWLGCELKANGRVLLHGGGMWPMLNEVLLIIMAGALNGVMEASGMLPAILDTVLKRIRSAGGLIMMTVGLSIAMSLVACNQSLSVIVPGRTLRPVYEKWGVPLRELVRSLADSGVVISPLIPWNLHGILCSAAMGISTETCFPYAFFLWGLPLLTLLMALKRSSGPRNGHAVL
jgi:NhaC family Na+:H+ antiporter